jgi:diguanylate cyclase (GGDEF)-like protein
VLIETDGNDAMQIAQRLCTSVANAMIVPPGAGRVKVTISVGLTQLKGRKITFDSMLTEADWAMYNAKQAGRNRVVTNEETS